MQQSLLTINSDQQYRYVGNLLVEFNRHGQIVSFDGRSGPVATTPEGVALLEDEVGLPLSPAAGVTTVFNALQSTPLIQDGFTVIGQTDFPLNGNRAEVRTRETNLGRLAADSTLERTRTEFPSLEVDGALKNGGGIRDSITGPNIIRLSVQAALAFDNTLAVLELTGDQLIAAIENSVSRAEFTDGRFPQVAGMTIEFDESQPAILGQESVTVPSRVRELAIGTDVLVANGIAQGDLSRSFVIPTNSFLTTGGDGYAAFQAARQLAVTDIGEQQILEEYIINDLNGNVALEDPPPNPRIVRQ